MSRGGRGGRGGRFGRGGGSVTHDLLRDNLEDLGIDSFQHSDDRVPPPLFPPVELPVPQIPNQYDLFAITKNRELTQRFRQSEYYLTKDTGNKSKIKSADILDNDKEVDTHIFSLNIHKNQVPDAWTRYVPYELFDSSSIRMKTKGKDINFNNLEQAEKSGGTGTAGGAGGEKKEGEESDEEGKEDEELEDVEVEDDDDYGVDHYASDNDYDDGHDDGGEATF